MFGDNVVEVKVLDFLNGECPYRGCRENDNGVCINQNLSMRSDILQHIQDSIKLNTIPPKEFFYCSVMRVRYEDIVCACGYPLLYKNDDKIIDGITIHGTIKYCPRCDE